MLIHGYFPAFLILKKTVLQIVDSSQSWESSGQLGLASGFMSQLKKHNHSQALRAPKQNRKIKNA